VTPVEHCRSYLESFATGDPDTIASHVTDDFVNEHAAALGTGCVGIDEYRKRLPGFIASMPGLRYEIGDTIAEGDRVVITYTLRCSAKPPDGDTDGPRDIAVRGAMRFDMRGGKIARRVDYWDSLVYLRQAGLA
jgi:predicted ester cyclase